MNNHQAVSIGYYAKFHNNIAPSRYAYYRQKNVNEKSPAQWFSKQLMELAYIMKDAYKNIKPMKLSKDQEDQFLLARKCHISKKLFTDPKNYKVKDHCHLTGKFRGAGHLVCNFRYNNAYHIPVVFHNLSNYDSKHILREIGSNRYIQGKMEIIPLNKAFYSFF